MIKKILLSALFITVLFMNIYPGDMPVSNDLFIENEYRVQPGDKLFLKILEHPDYSQELLIDQSGYIDYEFTGRILVKNKTLTELKRLFSFSLEKFFRNYTFTLNLIDSHEKNVMVLGIDEKAVKYKFKKNLRITDIFRELEVSFDPIYHYNIYVRRPPNYELKINGNELLFKGQMKDNIFIKDHDIIVVEKLFPLKTKDNLQMYYPVDKLIKKEYSTRGLDPKKVYEEISSVLSEKGKTVINPDVDMLYAEDFPENIQKIENIIQYYNNSKSKIKQVLIEAKLFEVTLSKNEVFGIDWQGIADRYDIDPNLFVSTNYKYNLLSFNDRKVNYTVILDALKEHGNINTLATPNIIVINKNPALISTGEQVPYRQIIQGGAGAEPVTGYEFKEIYLNFKVTPDIISDTLIKLLIEPEISSLGGKFIDDNPIVNTRKASTSVILEDKSYLFLGGILNERKSNEERKFPVLGDIPLIRTFFRKTVNVTSKTELVIFLKCSIITPGENVETSSGMPSIEGSLPSK